MQLRQLAAKTYAIESEFASLGVYLLDERDCLLIDSGHTSAHAREVLQILDEKGWAVHTIFNTHAHADHCGGNRLIQEHTCCQVYATAIEAAFIENPLLLPYSTYTAYPPKLLRGKFFMPQASRVTQRVEAGPVFIREARFEAVPLAGHSPGQMGLITPDGVLFAGDSLVSPQILKTFPCVFLVDAAQQFLTLDRLTAGNYKSIYLSHGGLAEDALLVITANYDILTNNLRAMDDIIQVPRSLEGVIGEFTSRQGVKINRNHYFRLSKTVSSMLAYLVNQGQASIIMQDNIPHYRSRGKKRLSPEEKPQLPR